MKRTQLKSKEVSEELEKYTISISKKDHVELLEEKYRLILINKKPAFFYYQDQLVPALKFLQEHNFLKKITVDMGAVKFVVNGADVMRPGIKEIEDGIKKDDVIVIIDEKNKKPLAVGLALFDSDEMRLMKSGKVFKNIHYVGDEIWKFA